MIKKFTILILAVIISGCYSVSKLTLNDVNEIPFDDRLIIGVVDFRNSTGNSDYDNLVKGITGTMISELQNTGHFRVIERERMNSIVAELNLSLSGLADPENAKKLGKMLGVDALLIGNLSSVKYSKNKQTIFIAWTEGQKVEVETDARLVNVETGEILAASSASAYIKQRNWVAFWFARLGRKTDKEAIVQTGITMNCRKLANDIAYKAPKKSEIK